MHPETIAQLSAAHLADLHRDAGLARRARAVRRTRPRRLGRSWLGRRMRRAGVAVAAVPTVSRP